MKNPFESGDVRVTSPYGMRGSEFHKGIDLVGTSSTRIVAVEDAVVAVSSIVTDRQNKTWEWGNYVRLDLPDGRRLYHCHLSQRLVRAGEKVKKGQVIGIMGATGNANGAHLHWELRPRGYSTESLDISEYSGIPNRRGVYDAESEAELPEETVGASFSVGERITLVAGAVYTNGVKVPLRYIGGEFTVAQNLPGRVLVRELYSWVEVRYVKSLQKTPDVKREEIAVGDRVKILPNASYTNGVRVPSRYIGKPFTVSQIRTGRVLVQELHSWVATNFVRKV